MKDYLLLTLPFIVLVPLWLLFWAIKQKRKHPLTPEALEPAAVLSDTRWLPSGLAAVLFLVVYDGAELVRRMITPPGALKLVLLAAPVLVFVWFSYAFLREFRGGDEFERRIQGVAAAWALWMFLFWSIGMWVMEEVWFGSRRGSFNAALHFLPLFYAVGMIFARGEYMRTARPR